MGQTLLLNADYQPFRWSPLSVLDWKEAIKSQFLEKVYVVDFYDVECRSPSTIMKIPAVVALKKYFYAEQRIHPSRRNILIRDDYTCQYCNKVFSEDELTLDHVLPKARGGTSQWTNLVAACKRCNVKKGHMMKMQPMRSPREVQYWEMVSVVKNKRVNIPHGSWQKYIQWPAKNVRLYDPVFN